mgnify:FL=1
MREYNYTDYAINNANSEAIVYRFANGKVREITVDDFNGDELAFRTWKTFSDRDYHSQEKQTRRTSRKDVSYDSLEEMDLGYSEGCLDTMLRTEDEEALSEGVEEMLSILSEKQRRRLYLYVIKGMKQEEIARLEGCIQSAVAQSIQSAEAKTKKYFEKISKTPNKNTSKMAMSERVNFYKRWLASHPDERDNSDSTLKIE